MKYLIIFLVFAVIGVFFLGEGFTGLVVGQSCCFPSEIGCSSENICNAARFQYPEPVSGFMDIFIGILLVLAFSFLIYKRYQERQKVPLCKVYKSK